MKAMLSRVADAVYWMSRYIERAENIARFVDVHEQLMLDMPGGGRDHWAALVATTGDDKLFYERYGKASRDAIIRFMLFDREYSNSMVSVLRMARENARSVRETISSEMWQRINKTYLMVNQAAQAPQSVISDPERFLSALKDDCHQFIGTMLVTMTHNEAWRLMTLGRVLERADKTSRLVDVKYFLILPDETDIGSAIDELQWASLLTSASALEMYRKRFGRIAPRKVADFLLLDTDFPRSVRYCVERAQKYLIDMQGSRAAANRTHAGRRLGRLQADLEYAVIDDIMETGLHEWVDRLQTGLNEVGVGIHDLLSGVEAQDTVHDTPIE